MEKIEIGYTLPKERWIQAAKNLEDLGNVLAPGLLAMNGDGRGQEDAEGLPNWVILGAETGNRADKVAPLREWVDQIVAFCEENEIPVFYKGNLREHFPDLPASAFPWDV